MTSLGALCAFLPATRLALWSAAGAAAPLCGPAATEACFLLALPSLLPAAVPRAAVASGWALPATGLALESAAGTNAPTPLCAPVAAGACLFMDLLPALPLAALGTAVVSEGAPCAFLPAGRSALLPAELAAAAKLFVPLSTAVTWGALCAALPPVPLAASWGAACGDPKLSCTATAALPANLAMLWKRSTAVLLTRLMALAAGLAKRPLADLGVNRPPNGLCVPAWARAHIWFNFHECPCHPSFNPGVNPQAHSLERHGSCICWT